jgi:hypothetical protein
MYPGNEIRGDCLEISKIDRGGGRTATTVLPVRDYVERDPALFCLGRSEVTSRQHSAPPWQY